MLEKRRSGVKWNMGLYVFVLAVIIFRASGKGGGGAGFADAGRE